MEERIKRIKDWLKDKKRAPLILQIDPTLKCNQNCIFCSMYNKNRNIKELSLNEYKKIIKEAKEIGIKEIRLVGEGEPLLYKEIIKLMWFIKKKKMFGFLVTNGISFNKIIIKEIKKMNWEFIVISLESHKAEIHNQLVNKEEAYKKVIKNIKLLNNQKGDTKLGINITLTNKNYKDCIGIIKLANKLKIKRVTFEPIIIKNKECRNLKLNSNQIKEAKEILQKTKKISKKLKIETNINDLFNNNFLNKKKITKCFNPFFYFSINASGKIGFCGDFSKINKLNITKNSIKKIWNGNWFNNYRNSILKGKKIIQCMNCCTPFISENNRIYELIKRG